MKKSSWTALALIVFAVGLLSGPAYAADKPNILVIWGDDIGQDNISAYHRRLLANRTPNIDRIANEGALFTDMYAQQSCTAGRAAFMLGQTADRQPSRDPYERFPTGGMEYLKWFGEHMFLMVPAQAAVAKQMESLKEFPPAQLAASMKVTNFARHSWREIR